MTDIIIKKDHSNPAIRLPNTGEAYDPSKAQDKTGLLASSTPKEQYRVKKDPKYDITLFARTPVVLDCVTCGGSNFEIALDSHPAGYGAAQFTCKKCGTISPVFQLKVPDMNDFRARKIGMIVPETSKGVNHAAPLAFDFEIES